MKKTKLLPILLLAVLLPSLSSCNESKWIPLTSIKVIMSSVYGNYQWQTDKVEYVYMDYEKPKQNIYGFYNPTTDMIDILELNKTTKELRYSYSYVISPYNTSQELVPDDIVHVLSLANCLSYEYVERTK